MNLQEYIPAASWLSKQDIMIQPMIHLNQVPTPEQLAFLEETHSGIITEQADIAIACSKLDSRSVFLSASADGELSLAHGTCRYLAENQEEIKQLDALVAPLLQPGYLEDIALRISHCARTDSFSKQNIPEFSRLIRRSENLAVRGLFLSFDPNLDLSTQAREAFSLVKKIRSDMPCMLHAFCFEGLLAPLYHEQTGELHKTLQMLSSLNDTSLYASFFLT